MPSDYQNNLLLFHHEGLIINLTKYLKQLTILHQGANTVAVRNIGS